MSAYTRESMFNGLEEKLRTDGVSDEAITYTVTVLDKILDLINVTAAPLCPDTAPDMIENIHIVAHCLMSALQLGVVREMAVLSSTLNTLGAVCLMAQRNGEFVPLEDYAKHENAVQVMKERIENLGAAPEEG